MRAVRATRFDGDYGAIAPFYALSPEELRARDIGRSQPIERWLAVDDRGVRGALHTWRRPDRRLTLHFAGDDPSCVAPLAAAVAEASACPVYTTVAEADVARLRALDDAGFATEVVSDAFRVRFDRALAALGRRWSSPTVAVVSAADADESRLFDLDNTIRQDVPGTDGWAGDRALFHDELTGPAFDPEAYAVAVDRRDGSYIGLARIWRNPDGPRFGLIGVARGYRRTTAAAQLLQRVLPAAATWGSETFLTETSRGNDHVHPRLVRLGAEHVGGFRQLVLPAAVLPGDR